MKDALGHGSEGTGNGTHSTAINSLPSKGEDWVSSMSDAAYHASMPPENFTGQVQDLLGMWNGSQKPSPLSASEKATVDAAYAKRSDWRGVAASLHAARTGTPNAPMVASKTTARGEGWA